jgi:hypothetical protein
MCITVKNQQFNTVLDTNNKLKKVINEQITVLYEYLVQIKILHCSVCFGMELVASQAAHYHVETFICFKI